MTRLYLTTAAWLAGLVATAAGLMLGAWAVIGGDFGPAVWAANGASAMWYGGWFRNERKHDASLKGDAEKDRPR